MSIAVETLPVPELPTPVVVDSEISPEKTEQDTESPDDWFTVDQFSDGWDINHVNAPTVFHRKLYTFNDNKAYINFSKVNKLIKNLDDLILFQTRSCCYRISPDRSIVVVGENDSDNIAVVGEFSPRFVVNNKICEFDDIPIKKFSDHRVVSLKQFESRLDGGVEPHLEAARARLQGSWESRRADIDALFE